MVTTILSTTDTGTGVLVVTTTDGVTPAGDFVFSETPPDGRSQAQWLIDCGNAALGVTAATLGDGAPNAASAEDTMEQTG